MACDFTHLLFPNGFITLVENCAMRRLIIIGILLLTACTDHKKEIAEQRKKIYIEKKNLFKELGNSYKLHPSPKSTSGLDSLPMMEYDFTKKNPAIKNREISILMQIDSLTHKYDSLGKEYDKY